MTRAHQLLWRFPWAEEAAAAAAMQAEGRVFQAVVAVEVQLADQGEVKAEEAVI